MGRDLRTKKHAELVRAPPNVGLMTDPSEKPLDQVHPSRETPIKSSGAQ